MPLFTRNKEIGVQSFILKVVNNNCPELEALVEGPRLDRRVNLVVVVLVVPVEANKPQIGQVFPAVTKEFSTTGLSLVFNEPRPLDEMILGFRWEARMTFVRAKARHLNPMGAGFYQLGVRMTEVLHVDDHPELQSLSF